MYDKEPLNQKQAEYFLTIRYIVNLAIERKQKYIDILEPDFDILTPVCKRLIQRTCEIKGITLNIVPVKEYYDGSL